LVGAAWRLDESPHAASSHAALTLSGGHRVLEVLGLTPSSVHNHVLEMDPVPRALLSVDPTFELLSVSGG
jgi:hypothetical protein